MTPKLALQIILIIAFAGMAFSGVLTWREFTAAAATADSCAPVGPAGTILGYPPCVYGLAMYALVAVIAALGLRRA